MDVKDGNMAIEEARGLVSDRLLWPLVRDFLWNFAPQVHGSWLDGLEWRETLDAGSDDGSSLVSRLLSSPRVKRYVLDSLGIEPCFHTFPKDDFSRLLLLDGATLESVARWLGTLACADDLRGVTDGATVRKLKAALPGVYPEVFGYTAYFGSSCFQRRDAGAQRENLLDDVLGIGCSLLYSVVSALSEQLLCRLKLKLPKQHAPHLCASSSNRPITPATISRLLKLKFPEAYRICCL